MRKIKQCQLLQKDLIIWHKITQCGKVTPRGNDGNGMISRDMGFPFCFFPLTVLHFHKIVLRIIDL